MPEEEMLYSHSEQLGPKSIRTLKETAKNLDLMLNISEYYRILHVYSDCMDRLLRENEYEKFKENQNIKLKKEGK